MQKQGSEEMLKCVPTMYKVGDFVAAEVKRLRHESSGQHEVKVSDSTSTCISDLDQGDVLDLEKMADKFEYRLKEAKTRRIIDDEARRYMHMHMVDYEKMRQNDACLKRAYDLLYSRGIEKFPHLVKKTEDMIDRLESQPHLYCPFERDETTNDHVTRWLNNHTTNPMAELHGFTSRDPYEPKRFIPDVTPRVSTSDTNVLLGKRKRNADDDDVDDVDVEYGLVLKSSSDTRLVCDAFRRPFKCRRRC